MHSLLKDPSSSHPSLLCVRTEARPLHCSFQHPVLFFDHEFVVLPKWVVIMKLRFQPVEDYFDLQMHRYYYDLISGHEGSYHPSCVVWEQVWACPSGQMQLSKVVAKSYQFAFSTVPSLGSILSFYNSCRLLKRVFGVFQELQNTVMGFLQFGCIFEFGKRLKSIKS